MKGVKNTSLLYVIPLITLLTIPMFFWNVYAVTRASSGGTEVIWGHIYPPSGGTYHYHTIGYFAWAAQWEDSFPWYGHGIIYMGGTEGTTSWYCGGQQWWSEPGLIKYNIKVIKIKDLTTQTEYTDPNILQQIHFRDAYVRPHGSEYVDEIVNLLWDIAQTVSGFSFPIPFKLLSSFTSVSDGWGEITVYGSGSLSEFYTKVEFTIPSGFNSTHTYEVTCQLTWTASFLIHVEPGAEGINPIDGESSISPESSSIVDTAYASAAIYITFTITPPG